MVQGVELRGKGFRAEGSRGLGFGVGWNTELRAVVQEYWRIGSNKCIIDSLQGLQVHSGN